MKAKKFLRSLFPYPSVKPFLRDLVHDAIGSILFALGIYTFASQASFAPGGITGIALIINHYVPFLRIGFLSLLLNIPVALICYRTLGRGFFLKSIKTMIISALFMDLVFPLFPTYPVEVGSVQQLLAALFAGAFSGAGLALIYMRGSSTGGTDFIIMSVRKKFPHLSIGTISFAIDGCVIFLGGLVFGNINAVLFGVLMTFVSTTIIDKLMYGSGAQRMLLVISDKGEEIAAAIGSEMERGVSLAKVRGAYTGNEHSMMMCVCSKSEVFHARQIVNRIDKQAMVMLTTVDEAYGLGFSDPEGD